MRRRRFGRCTALALVLVLCSSATAVAAVGDLGPTYAISILEQNLEPGTGGQAADASLAHDPERGFYLAVWGESTLTEDYEIRGRFIVPAWSGDAEASAIFQISTGGGGRPDVVYNPTSEEYLVAWHSAAGGNEVEIWIQRVSAVTGDKLGGPQRISEQGPAGNTDFAAINAQIGHNPTDNEYLVAWAGDTPAVGASDSKAEIFAQRLSATGAQLGGDMRISTMGSEDSTWGDAHGPGVAYSPTQGEYAVVWTGDHISIHEFEIYLQRIGRAGAAVGEVVRVSQMGEDGDATIGAGGSAITYNPTQNEYLVAWSGGDSSTGLGEIHVQRLSATGGQLGTNDQVITARDGEGIPDVAYSPAARQYMVLFTADNAARHEEEIFGQRLSLLGQEVGPDDQRISTMGPDGNPNYDGYAPAVVAGSAYDEFLVGWTGQDHQFPRREIFVRPAHAPPAGDDGSETDPVDDTDPAPDPPADDGDPPPADPLTGQPPLGPPPAVLSPPDTSGPAAGVTSRARQKAGAPVKVAVSCPAAETGGCLFGAKGTIVVQKARAGRASAAAPKRFKLRATRKQVAAGTKATLSLKPVGRKSAKQLKRLARKRAIKLTARVVVTAADAAGNTVRRPVKVTLTK